MTLFMNVAQASGVGSGISSMPVVYSRINKVGKQTANFKNANLIIIYVEYKYNVACRCNAACGLICRTTLKIL